MKVFHSFWPKSLVKMEKRNESKWLTPVHCDMQRSSAGAKNA
jgi:hypothetical protein